ncbi:MAG: ATP-binding protein [Bacteroidia bacterium]|nr:ATP-binding protein [Bacteroidia bacterium]
MNQSFQNRVASGFIISTATVVAAVFLITYFIVRTTVFLHLNNDISYEANKHIGELIIEDQKPVFRDKSEWMEREHRTIEVNPVFVQVTDREGKLVDKSPNLKDGILYYLPNQPEGAFFNAMLSGKTIRQVQLSMKKDGQIFGYLLVAMSLEDSQMVLLNLKRVLLIAFPVVLIVLFLIARFITGKNISPVTDIIHTASKITRENLSERIQTPKNEDELHTLVITINNLLDRIQQAVEREKQFTADASHELRTPLAVIKGTLEVLVRKPRNPEEYITKIQYAIEEINRMNHLVDQLLLLARFESQKAAREYRGFDLTELLDQVLFRQQGIIHQHQLKINLEVPQRMEVFSDPYMMDIILENLVSNAVKYSPSRGEVMIRMDENPGEVICTFHNGGEGIKAEELAQIFERFYRSDSLAHPQVKGAGLGLSIVRRMCDLLHTGISVQSQPGEGTTVILTVPRP